jgi:hypothetical protein
VNLADFPTVKIRSLNGITMARLKPVNNIHLDGGFQGVDTASLFNSDNITFWGAGL